MFLKKKKTLTVLFTFTLAFCKLILDWNRPSFDLRKHRAGIINHTHIRPKGRNK